MKKATIDASFNYADITSAIIEEEAYGYISTGSTLGKDDADADCNVVAFDYYDAGDHPNDCRVDKAGTSAPAGFKAEWSAKMWVQNQQQDSTLFRKQ